MKKNESGKGPFNYLKQLDVDMLSYPPYSSWDSLIEPMFSFYIVRYPFLRPNHSPEEPLERKLFDLQEQSCWISIHNWKKKLEKELPEVIEGLNEEQGIQLAALVLACIRDIEIHQIVIPIEKSLRKIHKEGEAKIKMLRSKLNTAIRNLGDLNRYATTLDSQYGFEELPPTVEKCLELLEKFKTVESIADDFHRCRESGEDLRSLQNEFTDPTAKCMVRLYWLYRHECQISGDEAEVRVALIRNKYWTEWVEPIAYRSKYEHAQSKGCEAVHTAVLRFGRF